MYSSHGTTELGLLTPVKNVFTGCLDFGRMLGSPLNEQFDGFGSFSGPRLFIVITFVLCVTFALRKDLFSNWSTEMSDEEDEEKGEEDEDWKLDIF
jgi:hypothetical protein